MSADPRSDRLKAVPAAWRRHAPALADFLRANNSVTVKASSRARSQVDLWRVSRPEVLVPKAVAAASHDGLNERGWSPLIVEHASAGEVVPHKPTASTRWEFRGEQWTPTPEGTSFTVAVALEALAIVANRKATLVARTATSPVWIPVSALDTSSSVEKALDVIAGVAAERGRERKRARQVNEAAAAKQALLDRRAALKASERDKAERRAKEAAALQTRRLRVIKARVDVQARAQGMKTSVGHGAVRIEHTARDRLLVRPLSARWVEMTLTLDGKTVTTFSAPDSFLGTPPFEDLVRRLAELGDSS